MHLKVTFGNELLQTRVSPSSGLSSPRLKPPPLGSSLPQNERRSRDVLPKINSNGRSQCALVCGRLAEFVHPNGKAAYLGDFGWRRDAVSTPIMGRLARSAAPTGAGCRRRSDRAGLVGARVAQGPYDVARRASCAPLSWASTNSARRPQTNAP